MFLQFLPPKCKPITSIYSSIDSSFSKLPESFSRTQISSLSQKLYSNQSEHQIYGVIFPPENGAVGSPPIPMMLTHTRRRNCIRRVAGGHWVWALMSEVVIKRETQLNSVKVGNLFLRTWAMENFTSALWVRKLKSSALRARKNKVVKLYFFLTEVVVLRVLLVVRQLYFHHLI